MISIKKIDDDTFTLKSNTIADKSFNADKNNSIPSDEEIQFNIRSLFSNSLESQLSSIKFFEYNLREFDIILPPRYIEITMNILHSHAQDQEIVNMILKLYRHCTSFQSEMQAILSEKNVIDLITPFFPSQDVLVIYGNLSIPSRSIRDRLLSMGILNQIISLLFINNGEPPLQINTDIFEYAVNLLNCLICKLDGFDYSKYFSEFIRIFEILHSLYANATVEQALIIIRAFSDYVDADVAFISEFQSKCQLRIFLEKDFDDDKISRWILDIIISITFTFGTEGAEFLSKIQIIDWISKRILSKSPKVVERCFFVLTQIIQLITSPHFFTNECINRNFLVIAIDKFNSNIKYRLKITLYRFICSVFAKATTSMIPLMINDKALELIAYNYDIISDNYEFDEIDDREHDWLLIFYAFQRIIPFYSHEYTDQNEIASAIRDSISQIKRNDEFIDWLFKLRELENLEDMEYDEYEDFNIEDLEYIIEILLK